MGRASTHPYPMLKSLAPGEIEIRTAVPGEVEDLHFILKYELPRQGSLAVVLQERYSPAFFGQYDRIKTLRRGAQRAQ